MDFKFENVDEDFRSEIKDFVEKELPWNWIYTGMCIGSIIILLDIIQEKRNSDFRFPVLAVAVGIYLPIGLSFPIFIGSLISYLTLNYSNEKGILYASGLITGEALMGIFIAIPIFITANPSWWSSILSINPINILGIILFFYVIISLYRITFKK